ncbi:MAG: UDP-N-acetylglucosamine--N-acetylmuramyl-(pentapeptide) pyrophosphoryl-undecaprenol N-acetylglucosamine transferase [Pseudomonadota bacterium]
MTDNAFTQPIVLAAGGTGGHMFPAEALAQELKRRGRRVLLVTDVRGARYAEDFPADDRFQISAATPSVGGPLAKGIAAFSLAQGLIAALGELRKRKPIAAVGFGGYPSLPSMKAASLLGVPYGVHEQNAVLGRANRVLARGAAFVAHAFPTLEKLPQGILGMEVGNPIRDAVADLGAPPFPEFGPDAPIRLVVFGGSQGASIFSAAPVAAIASLPDNIRRRLHVTHQARDAEADAVRTGYEEAGVSADVAPFFKDLPQKIADAHLVISRAGASTVTELSAIGRPSVLVPLGIAMDDHQTGNARVLADASAAIVIPEPRFNEVSLAEALAPLLSNLEKLKVMANAAEGRVKKNAARSLADLIEETIDMRKAA